MYLDWSLALTLVFILIFFVLILRYIWMRPENQAALMSLFNKARSHFSRRVGGGEGGEVRGPSVEQNPFPHPPNPVDVLRYRYHHGANVGSVFVLEKWLTPSMFHDSAQGSSELAAVEAWVKLEGLDDARRRFEKHWQAYVSDGDLDWLRNVARCTTVRLPIGYFTLGKPFCDHAAFAQVAAIYENAWSAVKKLIARCHERGIGVVVDLHGLPGGANSQEHSGSNSGKADLWDSHGDLQLATKSVCFVAREAKTMPGVAGIQIVNEAEWDAKGMYTWYDKVLSEVSHIEATIPIYVSDGWNFSRALEWSRTKNTVHATMSPVVVDTHLYWCFSQSDKHKSPQQIIHGVQGRLGELDGKDGSTAEHGACQAIVGEYSCVLTEDSWMKRHDTSKDQLVKEFGNAQCRRYQHRAGGSFFWTYRMDWMPGGEWGFRQMVEQQAVVPPHSLTLSAEEVRSRVAVARSQRDGRRGNAFGAHCRYWDSQYPGHYEHGRFEEGWTAGYEDATTFFGMRSQQGFEGGDKIGMLDLWCLKRLRESGQSGTFVWEWEHGFRQGVRDLYEAVGV